MTFTDAVILPVVLAVILNGTIAYVIYRWRQRPPQ